MHRGGAAEGGDPLPPLRSSHRIETACSRSLGKIRRKVPSPAEDRPARPGTAPVAPSYSIYRRG